MPLFVYVCKACQAEHELLVRGQETPACPGCGSTELVKQASAFAPLSGGARAAQPVGCGAASCCQLQGGGCGLS